MNYNSAKSSDITTHRSEFTGRGDGFTIGTQNLSVLRNTNEAFVMIIYKCDIRKRFRNNIMLHRGKSFAYGHGILFGRCRENSLRVIDGLWDYDNEIGLISFDRKVEANRFLEGSSTIRDQFWLQCSHDVKIVPAFMPAIIPYVYRFMQVDWYSVKRSIPFSEYVVGVNELANAHGGNFISATQDIITFKGICEPNYIIMIQWRTLEEFEQFDALAGPLFRNSSSACGSRLIYEFETFVSDNQ